MAMQLAGKGRVSYEIEAAFSHVSSAVSAVLNLVSFRAQSFQSSDVPEQFDVEYDSSAQPIVDAFVWYLPLTIAVQNQQYSDVCIGLCILWSYNCKGGEALEGVQRVA